MAQFDQLSDRQREVVKLLLEGKSNKLIASFLGISERTVEFHLKNIFAKFQVSSRVELILKLGQSTVDNPGESAENRDKSNSWKNWTASFRDTVSITAKELKMDSVLNSNSRNGGYNLTFYESIRVCLTKYADFNGRASRSEFWWFTLFITLVAAALEYFSQNLGSVFVIAILLPLLAAGTRRFHDIGKSPWWQLFLLVPFGFVVVGILWAQPPIVDTSS